MQSEPLLKLGIASLIVILMSAACTSGEQASPQVTTTTLIPNTDTPSEQLSLPGDRGSITAIDLPPVEDQKRLAEFLGERGVALVNLLQESEQLLSIEDSHLGDHGCEEIRSGLATLGSPSELQSLAAEIEDAATREIAQNLIQSTAEQLQRCGEVNDSKSLEEFTLEYELWQRRVNEITS